MRNDKTDPSRVSQAVVVRQRSAATPRYIESREELKSPPIEQLTPIQEFCFQEYALTYSTQSA